MESCAWRRVYGCVRPRSGAWEGLSLATLFLAVTCLVSCVGERSSSPRPQQQPQQYPPPAPRNAYGGYAPGYGYGAPPPNYYGPQPGYTAQAGTPPPPGNTTSNGAAPPVAPPPRATTYTVDVLNATVSPDKGDGRLWDGLPGGKGVPPEAKKAIAVALGLTNPQAAVAAVLADLMNKGMEPPDVAGTAEMFVSGVSSGVQILPKTQDSFLPRFNPAARFRGVVLDERVRIRIRLMDKDMGSFVGAETDDPIGDVELNATQLSAAAQSGGVYQVRVDNQHPNVYFIGVSVMPE